LHIRRQFCIFPKKTMRPFFLLCFCSCFGFLFGQDFTPKYEYFHGNNLRFSVSSDGRLFHGGREGDLRLDYLEDRGDYASSLQFAGLWMGALNAVGGLYTTVHVEDDEENGFWPGIAFSHLEGAMQDSILEGTNNVWRVTRAEILKHQRDYADNGRIDDPQPAIYAWPGARNPHFGVYNNTTAELPTELSGLAPYWDHDADGIYNPDHGDYPLPSGWERCGNIDPIPDEIFWVPFHNFKPAAFLNEGYSGLQFYLTGTIYYCGRNRFAEEARIAEMSHTIFLNYRFQLKGLTPLDSMYIGLLMDHSPECGPGGYLGSKPEQELLYFYNTRQPTASGCEVTEAVGCTVVNRPFRRLPSPDGGDTVIESRFQNFIQLFPEGEEPTAGQRFPQTPFEVYRCLNGQWRDGTPITYGQQGYEAPGNIVSAIFPDFPGEGSGWSELAAGNSPGRRMGLMSVGPLQLNPLGLNQFKVALQVSRPYFTDEPLNLFFADAEAISHWGDCFPPIYQGCVQEDLTPPEPEAPPVEPALFLWPNPTRAIVTLNAKGIPIYWYRSYNTKGQLMYANDAPDEVEQVPVSGWQTGVYFVQACWGGEVVTRKLLVR
jgi:hypothetical protein